MATQRTIQQQRVPQHCEYPAAHVGEGLAPIAVVSNSAEVPHPAHAAAAVCLLQRAHQQHDLLHTCQKRCAHTAIQLQSPVVCQLITYGEVRAGDTDLLIFRPSEATVAA